MITKSINYHKLVASTDTPTPTRGIYPRGYLGRGLAVNSSAKEKKTPR